MTERFIEVVPVEGELFSFLVGSRSRPSLRHRVEIDAYNWNGWCGCENFEFDKQALLERGAKKAENLRCRHIKAARSFFLDEILPKLADSIRKAHERIKTIQTENGPQLSRRKPQPHIPRAG